MYMVQILRHWHNPPDWCTLRAFADLERAERELDRWSKMYEVRLVNDAEDVKGDETSE